MSTFSFLLLCVQACLIQNVYSNCLGRSTLGYAGLAAPAIAPLAVPTCGAGLVAPALAPFGAPGLDWAGLAGPAMPFAGPVYEPMIRGGCGAAYGGSGIGNLAVAGELPVAGTTAVAGQVPIIGAVEFGGPAAAAGAVSIAGSCGCGCGAPYMY